MPTGHVPDYNPQSLQDPDEELISAVAGEPSAIDLLQRIISILEDIRERQDAALLGHTPPTNPGPWNPNPFRVGQPAKTTPRRNPVSGYPIQGNIAPVAYSDVKQEKKHAP